MTKAVPEELGFLFAGNATLVAVQNRIALMHAWRGGEIAFADGMGFVVPIRTVHAGLNPKYFGPLRGMTWYNLLALGSIHRIERDSGARHVSRQLGFARRGARNNRPNLA
jgi:Tn3 transposase DDE domain-containing protein